MSTEKTIHDYLGLSYANYLVLPRSVLQSMSAVWQDQFVQLLEQAEKSFGHLYESCQYKVRLRRESGKGYVHDPLADYERGRRILEPKAVATGLTTTGVQTVHADEDSGLSPEALLAMGAEGGPRKFWFTLKDECSYVSRNRIEADFTEAEEWELWATDTRYVGSGDAVCLAINPTIGQLRSLLNGVGWKPTALEVPS